jgi:hypothetical protein
MGAQVQRHFEGRFLAEQVVEADGERQAGAPGAETPGAIDISGVMHG